MFETPQEAARLQSQRSVTKGKKRESPAQSYHCALNHLRRAAEALQTLTSERHSAFRHLESVTRQVLQETIDVWETLEAHTPDLSPRAD